MPLPKKRWKIIFIFITLRIGYTLSCTAAWNKLKIPYWNEATQKPDANLMLTGSRKTWGLTFPYGDTVRFKEPVITSILAPLFTHSISLILPISRVRSSNGLSVLMLDPFNQTWVFLKNRKPSVLLTFKYLPSCTISTPQNGQTHSKTPFVREGRRRGEGWI